MKVDSSFQHSCFKVCSVIFVFITMSLLSTTPSRPAIGAPANAGPNKTLSPYFLILDGDESVDRLPLKKTEVSSKLVGTIAEVQVRQTYENQGKRALNIRYVFPASTRAAVHSMTMQVGDRQVRAQIKEKKEAKRQFEQAKKQGKTASLLSQKRPNVFTMDLANVVPGDTVTVEMGYSEYLDSIDGIYEFVFPAVVGPRFSDIPVAEKSSANDWIQSPYLHPRDLRAQALTKFEIDTDLSMPMPIRDLNSPSHTLAVDWHTSDSVGVKVDKTDPEAGKKDFILRFRLADQAVMSGVVAYDGSEDPDSEVESPEKFFVLTVEPPERVEPDHIPTREYVFVIDVSGSMSGFPLDVAKELMRHLLGDLRPTDLFNVVQFAGSAHKLAPRSLPATTQNISNGIALVNQVRGGGSTQLYDALDLTLEMSGQDGVSRHVVLITDGYIVAEENVFSLIKENMGQLNVHTFGIGSSVNRHLVEGVAHAGLGESYVLTDATQARNGAKELKKAIESPVLTDIDIRFDGLEVYDVLPAGYPDVLSSRPLTVYGKYRGDFDGEVIITGRTGKGAYRNEIELSEDAVHPDHRVTRYLWARKKIDSLERQDYFGVSPDTKAEITDLGLSYSLLTKYTSFIAVDERIRDMAGDATDIKQPLPLPKGVSTAAIGRASSEPEWMLVLLLGVLATLLAFATFNRTGGQNRWV